VVGYVVLMAAYHRRFGGPFKMPRVTRAFPYAVLVPAELVQASVVGIDGEGAVLGICGFKSGHDTW
jgi:hypothetical protein